MNSIYNISKPILLQIQYYTQCHWISNNCWKKDLNFVKWQKPTMLARCQKGTYPQKITRYVALPVTESGPPPLPLPLVALPQHDETLSLSEAKLVCVVCFVVKHCINSSVVQDSQLLLDTYTTINPDCYVCNRRLLVRVSNILAVLIKIWILLNNPLHF